MQDYAKPGRNKDEWNGSTRFVLHNDTSSSGQGAYDRGSIRMFEERMDAEQNGDWLSGSRDSQEAFSQFVITIAKEKQFFIPEEKLHLLGEKKNLPSGESVIYENATQGVIYKVRNPFAKLHLKSGRAVDVLYDHVIHNLLFPEASYRLIGISSYLGEVRFVLSQEFFYTQSIPSQKQIDSYLQSMGLYPENSYYFGNEYVSITDVSANSDNVLFDSNGKLLFIDPIIKMKQTADAIIKAYPFSKPAERKELTLWSRICSLFRLKS